MAKSDDVLDRVFRKKLENHQESPRPSAWDKLEAQLDAGKQPKRNFWWAIAAAMPLLLGLGYLIWSQAPQADQESFLATTEEVLEIPPVLEQAPEAERVVSEVNQKPVTLAETSGPSKSTPNLKSSLPKENSQKINLEPMVAEAITLPIPQEAVEVTGNTVTESKIWVNPEPTKTLTTATSSQASLADAEEMDGYRIRIFSDGLKKEEPANKNLITELGKTVGQVEGLLDKLDVGFVEIQEKKERFFSSLTSRRAASTEKQ
jgi:hypothetical protein